MFLYDWRPRHGGALMSPSAYIIAGPNGTGKTTFAREFLPSYADCRNFINADLIAQGVSPFMPETVAFRAGRLILEEIDLHVKRGESFGFETTLSGRSYLHLALAPFLRHSSLESKILRLDNTSF